ncbi:DUF2249 domain-containing protein [Acidiphilium sp.]|jgi:uncharacterized protein (DUF2249 family)|uniref:DUF2249 domain-containing protein n=1 Tax=Acidiphilium sp. TaxID=527 RepID=UPI00258EF4C9|nr:DUF2249 domain-containing protein [Acidiphilium sp.]
MNTLAPLTLDVRPELRAGGEPFPRIMQALASLAPGQALRLLATFEPIPLYGVLGRKGFAHHATRHGPEDWEILFTPAEEAAAPRSLPAAGSRAGEGAGWPEPMQSLDNRGLQPPEPMMRILSALENLAPGAVLEAWNDREPLLLYPELEARGAVIAVSRKAEGVRLLIRRGVTP